MSDPCQHCGADCSFYRVSFYWSETAPILGGSMPPGLSVAISSARAAMRCTTCAPVRCVAPQGQVGDTVACDIYVQRPSPCREVAPWDEYGLAGEKCGKARAGHGLTPLPRSREPPLQPDTPWWESA